MSDEQSKEPSELRKRYFTEKGEEALFKRLDTLVDFYQDVNQVYPVQFQMIGFLPLKLHSSESLLAQIDELRQILGLSSIKFEIKDRGRTTIKEMK